MFVIFEWRKVTEEGNRNSLRRETWSVREKGEELWESKDKPVDMSGFLPLKGEQWRSLPTPYTGFDARSQNKRDEYMWIFIFNVPSRLSGFPRLENYHSDSKV